MTKKILIIDDEPDSFGLTTIRLKASGYDVLGATNRNDAFHILETEVPDLILLDVVMPGASGYEICNEIKSEERTSKVPIILFTAKPDQKKQLKSNTEFIAADDCILKPFEPAELLKKIKSFIG